MGKCSVCYSNHTTEATCPLVVGPKLDNCVWHYNAEIIQLLGNTNQDCIDEKHQHKPSTNMPLSVKCHNFYELSEFGQLSARIGKITKKLKDAYDSQSNSTGMLEVELKKAHKILSKKKKYFYNKLIASNIAFIDKHMQYMKINILCGKGSFKRVFLGYDLDKTERVAWVQMRGKAHNSEITQRLENEINILKNIKHENIVDLITSWYDSRGGQNAILEYLEYSLQDVKEVMQMRKIDPVHHAGYLHDEVVPQILSALIKLNQEIIVHRDIKPDNIGISIDGKIKIMDFSEATLYSNDEPKRLLSIDETREINPKGSVWYMPPESFASIYDSTSDVYSLGITILELLSLIQPGDIGPNTDQSCMIQKFRLFNQYESLTHLQVLKKEYSNFIDLDTRSNDMVDADIQKILNLYEQFGKYGSFFKMLVSDCIGKPDDRMPAFELREKYYVEPNNRAEVT